ncbi:hypothetical protein C8Q74DRAFT_528203 [Fomes fomentarius]|nr:hypothetical protein C8Q74DRAFT_528203 [Fomes fomentarius]
MQPEADQLCELLPPRLAQKEGRCLANASRNQPIHGLPPRVPGPASPSLLDDALMLISPQIPSSTLYLTLASLDDKRPSHIPKHNTSIFQQSSCIR